MNKKFNGFIINTTYFILVSIMVLIISTIALTYKINEERAMLHHSIVTTIVKEKISILSLTQGVIKKIYVKPGQVIKKGVILAEIDNPVLRGTLAALQNEPDNASARTQAAVAQVSLRYFTIASKVNGVVSDIYLSEGAPVEDLTKIMDIYSNDNTKLISLLTSQEYTQVKNLTEIKAYSQRLDQNFLIKPDSLQPDIVQPTDNQDKKIGLYFVFIKDEDPNNFINNEDLILKLNLNQKPILKPFDYIVNFWNSILFTDQQNNDY